MAETSGRDTKEYRAIQHHYATVIHTLAKTVNPALFAGRLLEKSLISEDIVEKASVVGVLTGSERISPVMDAVLAQVGLKADLFHTFMAELKETNRHLWGVIQQYYSSSSEDATSPASRSEDATSPASSSEDATDSVSEEYCSHEMDTVGQVKRLNVRFIKLQIRLRRELMSNQVSVEDVQDSITLLPTSIRTEHYQFIKECSDDIEKADSIRSLFRHLNLYWTYLEYSLMDHIIESHSDKLSNELKKVMRVYMEDMETFKKRTTVEQLLQVGLGCIRKDPPPGFSCLKMKLEREPSDFTLEELEAVRRRIGIEFNLPTFALMLASVERSSLCIKWHIPSSEVHRFEATILPAVHSRISADLIYFEMDISTLSSSYTAAEYKRIYEEALSTGYINTRNSVVVLNGAGGSGMTHVKEAISGRPPPSIRESTALSEDPTTFSVVHARDGLWKVMDKEQHASMLASAMAAMVTRKRSDTMYPRTTPPSDSALPSPTTDTNVTATSSSGAMPLPLPTATPTLEPVGPAPPTPPSPPAPPTPPSPPLQPRRMEAHHEEPHPVESDFLDRIGRAQATVEEPYNYDLVYLFDTGGHPAIHAVLPLFFPLVMFNLFVLKLSEKLDHHPKVHYFVQGKPVGAPYTSPLSHLQIAQHFFCAVQSQMLAQQHSGKGLPKMMIVGTHRDLEWHCTESVREKNRKLSEILSPSFKEHLIYRSAEGNSLIFPLDAKHRKQKDCEVAAEIRQAITMATSEIERKRTPLSWHFLELALRQLAGKLGRVFLTRAECVTEASMLDISERVFDAALDHFVHLNTILYYRTVLPDLVFIRAQPLMEKISELIQHTHALRGQVPDKCTPIQGKWLKFRDEGVVTLDILESFPDSYLEGVFTAADLIRLMEHKLLVSSIDQSSYFMPVLLPDLSPEEVALHRAGPDSAIAPLMILFPCDLVPTGLFCSLVSSLLSAAMPPQFHLKYSPSDWALVECVSSNCIKFTLDNIISLVLINTHSHLELHLSDPMMHASAPLCLALKAKVLASIATATHALHFEGLEPQCGFLCEASTPHAMVRVTPERHWLGRLVLGDPRLVEVAPPTHPALLSKEHGWVCSLDYRVCGPFQERHAVWLQPHEDVLERLQERIQPVMAHAAMGHPSDTDGSTAPPLDRKEITVKTEGGALAGHPSDAIFDQFPECKTAPPLGPGDLGQVLRVLHDAGLAAKWRAIGQTLTVSDDDLAGFEVRFSGDPSLCLLQVVASWLRGETRLSNPPSWWLLVWAVADPQGGGTVHGGKRMAAMLRAQDRLSKFVVTSIHAEETPPSPLLDDFSGGPHIYDGVDEATEALSRELPAVAHRWVQVGVLLGVAFSWLEQRRSAGLPDWLNMEDTLHHWLDTLGEAVTLQRLVEAVEHSAGGNNPILAAAIKSKLESTLGISKEGLQESLEERIQPTPEAYGGTRDEDVLERLQERIQPVMAHAAMGHPSDTDGSTAPPLAEDSSVLPDPQPKARPLLSPPSPLLLDDRVCGQFQERHTVCLQSSGEQSPVVGAVEDRAGGGGAEGGSLAGHPSDAIFDQFPECKTAPPLGPGDLGQVLRVLHDAGLAARWRAIGQTLTVSDDDLAGFDARFSGDPSLCLLQVVDSWLHGETRLPDPPSWWLLVWAVADPQGGGTVNEGMRIAAMFKAEGGLSMFIPTCTHAKETPPTLLFDDFSGGPWIYDDMDEAMETLSRELSAVAHRWFQVGVLLGVELHWLEQRRNAGQPDSQNLDDTLDYWLESCDEAVTLQRLVEAVEHSAGGNNPILAAAIKSKLESELEIGFVI